MKNYIKQTISLVLCAAMVLTSGVTYTQFENKAAVNDSGELVPDKAIQGYNQDASLFEGANHGVIANDYSQKSDTETNIFVGKFYDDADMGASENYSNAGGENYIGEIVEGSVLKFHLPPKSVELGDKAWEWYEANKGNKDKVANVTGTSFTNVNRNVANVITQIAGYYDDFFADVTDTLTDDGENHVINMAGLPADGTYVINYDGTNFGDKYSIINLKEGQHLIINLTSHSSQVEVGHYKLNGKQVTDYVALKDVAQDWTTKAVIFNDAKQPTDANGAAMTRTISMVDTAGVFIAPYDNLSKGSTCGGIAVFNEFHSTGGEWHYHNHNLPGPTNGTLTLKKTMNGQPATEAYEFVIHDAQTGKDEIVSNDDQGNINWDIPYAFNNTQTYSYTVTEKHPDGAVRQDDGNWKYQGVTYDGGTITVSYQVQVENGNYSITNTSITKVDGNGNPVSENTDTFANGYASAGSTTFKAHKVLEGATLTAGQFHFQLLASDQSTVLATADNDANGDVSFDFTANYSSSEKNGSVTYTNQNAGDGNTFYIREVVNDNERQNFYTYDETFHEVTVTKQDNGDGTITCTVNYVDQPAGATAQVITNTYQYTASGTPVFTATKSVVNADISKYAGQFNFVVMHSDTVVANGTNDASGNVTFTFVDSDDARAIYTYDQSRLGKLDTYTIEETAGSIGGISYDATKYEVTVTPTDKNHDGQIEFSYQYKKIENGKKEKADSASFVNEYKATGEVVINGRKTLKYEGTDVNVPFNEGDFQFGLYYNKYQDKDKDKTDFERIGDKVSNGAYDSENHYAPVTFPALKYSLNEDGKIVDQTGREASSDGTFTYYVIEDKGGNKSISYDQYRKLIIVHVADDGNGHINAYYTLDDHNEQNEVRYFNNTIKAEGSTKFEATKKIDFASQTAYNRHFTFELLDSDAKTVLAKGTNINGKVKFYTDFENGEKNEYQADYTQKDLGEGGTFTKEYFIREVQTPKNEDDKKNITFDTAVWKVVVVGTDDGKGKIEISKTFYKKSGAEGTFVAVEGIEKPQFINQYDASGKAELHVQKTMTGTSLVANKYSFHVEGYKAPADAYANEDGQVRFLPIQYKLADLKDNDGKQHNSADFVYTITENHPKDAKQNEDGDWEFNGITYSGKSEQVTVHVHNEGDGNLSVKYYRNTAASVSASVVYDDDVTFKLGASVSMTSAEFTNTYNAEGQIPFTAKKYIENNINKDGKFTFILSGHNVTQDSSSAITHVDGTKEVSTDKDGHVDFGLIKFNQDDLERNADGSAKETKYEYTIREVIPEQKLPGYKYDESEKTVVLTLTDDGKGGITVTSDKKISNINITEISFTNIYKSKGSANFKAHKKLEKNTLENGQFSFIIEGYKVDGTPVEKGSKVATKVVTCDANGYVDFGVINYDQSDINHRPFGTPYDSEYTYTVREVIPDKAVWFEDSSKTYDQLTDDQKKTGTFTLSGITYDTSVKTITVKLHDNGDGTISVNQKLNDTFDFGTFTNKYNAKGTATVEATKKLANANNKQVLKGKDYTFQLQQVGADGSAIGNPMTATNDAQGRVSFKLPEFGLDSVGQTYTYEMSELVPSKADPDLQYSDKVYVVTITPRDLGDGTIECKPIYALKSDDQANVPASETAPEFINTYINKGEAVLQVTKTLSGRDWKDNDSFEIQLFDITDGATTEAKQTKYATKENQIVAFDAITYHNADAGKTFIYRIHENADLSSKSMSRSGDIYVKVVITKNTETNGLWTATTYYKDENCTEEVQNAEIVNTYTASGSARIEATKTLIPETSTLKAGDFTFVLTDADGKVLQTKSNGRGENVAVNKVVFDSIPYTQEHLGNTFTYKMYEVKPAVTDSKFNENMEYSDEVYVVTVTPEISKDDPSKLVCTPVYRMEGQKETSESATFTNKEVGRGSVILSVNKVLTGRTLDRDDVFTFDLYETTNHSHKLIQEDVTNDAAGKVNFGAISYGKNDVGTHTYSIEETGDYSKKNITKGGPVTATVVVAKDDADNSVKVTSVSYSDNATITNHYTAEGTAHIDVLKTLKFDTLKDGQFKFKVEQKSGNKKSGIAEHPEYYTETKSNGTGGRVSFELPKFDQNDIGTEFTYEVSEVIPDSKDTKNYDSDMEYDHQKITVTITPTYTKKDGKIECTPVYSTGGTEAQFTNYKYHEGVAQLHVTKKLTGRTLTSDDDFTFDLLKKSVAEDGTVTWIPVSGNTSVRNVGNTVTFNPIKYGKDDINKTYTYKVHETGEYNGITNGSDVTATVKVTKDANGKIQTEIAYTSDATIINTYQSSGHVVLNARKILQNQKYQKQDGSTHSFDFILEDANGQQIGQTKTVNTTVNGNAADGTGSVSFDQIPYTQADMSDGNHGYLTSKEITYYIRELIPEGAEAKGDGIYVKNGITYDGSKKAVKVTLTDDGNGHITAVADQNASVTDKDGNPLPEQSDVVITNTYDASGAANVVARKLVNNEELKTGAYSFELKSVGSDKVDQIKKNGEKGEVADVIFDPVTYTLSDVNKTFEYTLREVIPSGDKRRSDMDYDERVITVKVTPQDNGDGTLTCTPEYTIDDKAVAATFTNTKVVENAATLSVNKTLTGRDWTDTDVFTFELYQVKDDEQSNDVLKQTKQNADDDGNRIGSVTFDPITYDNSDVGNTYTYRIHESSNFVGITNADDIYAQVSVSKDNHELVISKRYYSDRACRKALTHDDTSVATMINTYAAKGKATVLAKKIFDNGTLAGGDFSFNLKLTKIEDKNGNVIELDKPLDRVLPAIKAALTGDRPLKSYDKTVSNTADGKIRFTATDSTDADVIARDGLSFTNEDKDKTFTYELKEIKPEDAPEDIDYDGKTIIVKITPVDNGRGTMVCQPEYYLNGKQINPETEVQFINTKVDNSKALLQITKAMSGRALAKSDDFTFQLEDLTNKKVVEKDVHNDGSSVSFAEISYKNSDAGKTFEYKITETNEEKNGITNGKPVYAQVKVTKADGKLSTAVKYYKDAKFQDEFLDNKAVITNTYKAEGQTSVAAKKVVNNAELKAGQYSFGLSKVDGSYLETKSNDADGNITFTGSEFKYDQSDIGKTYTYKLREVVPAKTDKAFDKNMIYDERVITVTIAPKDDDLNGIIECDPVYTIGEGSDAKNVDPTFVNTEVGEGQAVLQITKAMTGRQMTDADVFTFDLLDQDGETIQTKQNVDENGKAIGTVVFDALTYGMEDAGKTFTYTIHETSDNTAAGITNGDDVTATVKVSTDKDNKLVVSEPEYTSNATITNTYTAAAARVRLAGQKQLTNGDLASVNGQFRFDLFDADGNSVIDTAKNDETGKFTFGGITITKPGDYKYYIAEQNGGKTINGIRYTDAKIPVTIKAEDNGQGQLVAKVYDADGQEITSADQITLTNEQLTSLHVEKTWNDSINHGANRPDSIKVNLYKLDGEKQVLVKTGIISADSDWKLDFNDLEAGNYKIEEVDNPDDYYTPEQAEIDITLVANGENTVTLVNDYKEPGVTINARKVLNGKTLEDGQFIFELKFNSLQEDARTTNNTVNGDVTFTNVPYDPEGYTVRELAGDDQHIVYSDLVLHYDADANLVKVTKTSGEEVDLESALDQNGIGTFTNTYRPMVLRVQKTSKEEPHDPLVGATYGLYQVTDNGADVLVESQVSDSNGYMYYGEISENTVYYFKEIAAPEGHEVDPYPGQKFMIKYVGGKIHLYDETGKNEINVGDITEAEQSNEKNAYVQSTEDKKNLDEITAPEGFVKFTYSDDEIDAVAIAPEGSLPEGTSMVVTKLNDEDAQAAELKAEAVVGRVQGLAYYDVSFWTPEHEEKEPEVGSVQVTINPKNAVNVPEGTDTAALRIVHLTENKDADTTSVELVPGSVSTDGKEVYQTSFTSKSFSTFGLILPDGSNSTLNGNYMLTAAGVSDQVSELSIAKVDTSGKYIKGAVLQIIEAGTGDVKAEWNTKDLDSVKTFARWFDDAKSVPMNVETRYILHEVSAPDGYALADDILFSINQYDSSITVYKYDKNGDLVRDTQAIDQWTSDHTLKMIDIPIKETVKEVRHTYPTKLTITKDKEVVETVTTTMTRTTAPQTGDSREALVLILILIVFAGAGVLILLKTRKK